jgi:2-methylcitrate dehydratase PrpD
MEKTPIAVQLGEFVAALRFDDLPPAVVDKAKAVVNHAVTVGMAGFAHARSGAARQAVLGQETLGARRVGAGQGATLWVDGTRVTRVGAAFASGVAVAVNNQCDSYHMLTHPGVLIVPAGVATAEGEGRTGRELLTALVAGYEVQCRCARDFIPSTPAHGFRASPVYGILGCAATTAKLLGLDAAQTTHAIALAASFAGSLIEGQRTGARDADFAEAQAARSGMWAATLAAQGFQGSPTALEGRGGFYNAFTGSHRGDLSYSFTGAVMANLDDVVAELGRRWEILDVKFKIYPTPGFNQPVVWLASEMTTQHKLRADEIERITLEMNYLETLYPTPRFPRPPASDGSGFGRTAYMVAATVVVGDYPVLEKNVEDPRDTGAAADEAMAARVAALQRRVEIVGVVDRDCFAPRMTFILRDGRRVTGEYHGRELMWDFARDARELRRFIPGLPIAPSRYDELVQSIANLDAAPSVDAVLALTLPG